MTSTIDQPNRCASCDMRCDSTHAWHPVTPVVVAQLGHAEVGVLGVPEYYCVGCHEKMQVGSQDITSMPINLLGVSDGT